MYRLKTQEKYMSRGKPWVVFSKWGQEIARFQSQLQADAYAKAIAGATVRYVGG